MASSPVDGARDHAEYVPPMESACSSAQVPFNARSSLLRLLLGIYIVRRRSLATNDIPTGAPSASFPTAPCAATNVCYPTAPSATNDKQALFAAKASHTGVANPSCTATFVRNIYMLLCSGRLVSEERSGRLVSEERTLAPPGMCHQFLLPVPVIAAISKIPHFWNRLACLAVLSYVMNITGQGATIFRGLSSILAQGGFTTRLCGYIIRWFGYEGLLFVRAAEFVDLVSTFFRHASSSLKSASDILSMISAFHPSNGSSSDTLQESVPLDDEPSSQEITSTDHTSVQCIIVSSVTECESVISQWKTGNAQISVDVPPTMSRETADALKRSFEAEGVVHLLSGPIINTILKKDLNSENAPRNVEKIQDSSFPLPSPDVKTNQ